MRWIAGICFFVVASATVPAQTVQVRPVEQMTTPSEVDSNSPAFWWEGRLRWFNSTGAVSLYEGNSREGPWERLSVEFLDAYPAPHWMEAVWTEADGTLWGWYHCEPVGLFPGTTMTAPKIGAVVSFDGGKTMRDLGPILEDGAPFDPTAKNGYFAGGHGDFSVVWDPASRFFYFFFDNYGGAPESQGVCLARMAFEDRDKPTGKVWKYFEGDWQEPGLGGRTTPVFPVARAWQMADPDAFWGPSVHWNEYLNRHVMLMNHAAGLPGWAQEGVYISFLPDLTHPESWTKPAKILGKTDFPGWYFFYPQVMGAEIGDTDTVAGNIARLFVGGISRWELEFQPAPPEQDVAPAEEKNSPEVK